MHGADTLRCVTAEDTRRHFVVCGETPMAYRLIEELITQYDAHVVAVVGTGDTPWAARIQTLAGVEIVRANRLDAQAFAAARIEQASSLALVDQDDAANVEAALLAQEINPQVRIVIRMFKAALGQRISALLNNCIVLSAAAIAAPAFVAAALDERGTPPIQLGDRTVVGILRERTRPDEVLAGLAVMGPRGTVPEVLPPDADERCDFVLAKARPAPPPRPPRPRGRLRFISIVLGPRLRLVVAVFLVLYAIGTAILAWAQGQMWSEAAYSALVTALTGNAAADTHDGLARFAVIMLTVVSIGLIPALTATIIDSLVKARLERERGGLYEPIDDHIVVIGLGDVGTRVISALHQSGVEVVAIERDPDARGVQVARELGIPVFIADGSRSETLVAASVATCRALVVASTDDVSNLETALLGRELKADLRVVLRLFDGEFAERVRHAFNLPTSRSVSYLAAPAFAAAMIGRQVLATIPVRRRVLLLAELPVGEHSRLEHKTLAAVNRPHEARLLAIRTSGQVLWRPSEGRPMRSTDRLLVVTTRAGLSHLLTDTAPGASDEDEAEPTPFRLLQPWEIPHTRQAPAPPSATGAASTPADQPGSNPPFGPADGGWTGRA
jgi:Trk K+ transport system NAD-binding subunit